MIGPPLDKASIDNDTAEYYLALLSAFAVATALLRESIATRNSPLGAQAVTAQLEVLVATEALIGPINVTEEST